MSSIHYASLAQYSWGPLHTHSHIQLWSVFRRAWLGCVGLNLGNAWAKLFNCVSVIVKYDSNKYWELCLSANARWLVFTQHALRVFAFVCLSENFQLCNINTEKGNITTKILDSISYTHKYTHTHTHTYTHTTSFYTVFLLNSSSLSLLWYYLGEQPVLKGNVL